MGLTPHARLFIVPIFIIVFIFFLAFLLEEAAFGPFDAELEFARLVGFVAHVFLLAESILPEVEQGIVQQLHAVFLPGLDRGIDAVRLGFADQVGDGGRIDVAVAEGALQMRFALHDKSGEAHFNLLSAYHKSLRGSDPQAALYWMARMIEGGEDPLTIFRRSIAMAAEDVGLADPEALQIAVAARDAYHVLGAPEGYLPLAEMVVYLATAPKSNSAKKALDAALEAARETPGAAVPLDVRNAPTKLSKELGYHAGYRYAHDSPEGYFAQEYLPEELRGARFYEPGRFGFEKEIAKRLEWWAGLRAKEKGEGDAG